jgi:RNA polymerase sigma-70 factor (ECF subfamily)
MNLGIMYDQPASAGDRFLELLSPLERDLETYARRLLWEPQQLQDAIQNAILHAYAAFDRYREDASFRAWLFKILTREILTLNRKHARIAQHEFQLEPEEIEDLPQADSQGTAEAEWGTGPGVWSQDLDDELSRALRTLTDIERAVLLLRGVGEFRYREISAALDIPLGTVMGDLARARQKMRAALQRSRNFVSNKRNRE